MGDIDDAIQRLQEELNILKRAKAIIKAKGLASHHEALSSKGIGKGRADIKPDSDAGQAWAVLREAGTPLHVTDILKAIEKKKGKAPVRASLVSALARYSKKKRVFYRARPNTFGLLELKADSSKITE